MSDIRLPLDGTIFALRAVILCVRDGQLLTIRGDDLEFKYLPGGAACIGESTAEAAAREWAEETGLTAGPLRLVGLIENFFEMAGNRGHEVGFYYRLDSGDTPANGTPLGDQPGQYWDWVALNALTEQRVYPLAVSQLLAAPARQTLHLIQRG